MKTHGLPKNFWVVLKPSPGSAMEDILFACTFSRLMSQVRGGLHEDEIAGIYADEGESQKSAARLLGQYPVRPQDVVLVEVAVSCMVQSKGEGMTAKDLAKAAVEAVKNAIRQAEEAGFQHRLQGQITLGAGTVELTNQSFIPGG